MVHIFTAISIITNIGILVMLYFLWQLLNYEKILKELEHDTFGHGFQ